MRQKMKDFFEKYKGEIGVTILFLYVVLLGFGTVGEIFEIEWILNFPLFKF